MTTARTVFSGRTLNVDVESYLSRHDLVFRFDTAAGGVYLAERCDTPAVTDTQGQLSGRRNEKPKRFGPAWMGKPRQY